MHTGCDPSAFLRTVQCQVWIGQVKDLIPRLIEEQRNVRRVVRPEDFTDFTDRAGGTGGDWISSSLLDLWEKDIIGEAD